jgi:uncharacterized protein (DUF169 family)
VKNVRDIQGLLGAAWTSVKFYFSGAAVPDIKVGTDLRFCEAVTKARAGPLLLHPGAVSCPGANYVFGWERNEALRNTILGELMKRRGLGRAAAEKLISQVPVFEQSLVAIGLNTGEVPDLIISYCQPPTVMDFLKLWQTEFDGYNLVSSISSVLSVCGNVAIGCYLTSDVVLSFGCDDAREFAGIGRDRLVIGIPYPLVEKLATRSKALQSARVP